MPSPRSNIEEVVKPAGTDVAFPIIPYASLPDTAESEASIFIAIVFSIGLNTNTGKLYFETKDDDEDDDASLHITIGPVPAIPPGKVVVGVHGLQVGEIKPGATNNLRSCDVVEEDTS
jgi:hypothetical protein